MEIQITYYENVLDFLTSQLYIHRYSSVCFELVTILIARLYRAGYICTYSETTSHWTVSV